MESQKAKSLSVFQMPLHYPKYTVKEYEEMPEWRLDQLLAQYGLPTNGDLDYKREFAMGAFLWPSFGRDPSTNPASDLRRCGFNGDEPLFSKKVTLNILKEFESLEQKITCSPEAEPLGTAGPLALARSRPLDDLGQPFFVLNSDVISEYPFEERIEFQKSRRGLASIMVT